MQPTQNAVIERPDDLTCGWLTTALGAGQVTDFSFERIGTGQMSECYRVSLRYAETGAGGADGPASVVLKVAATDRNSRQTGLALGLYEREVRFYTDIAPQLRGGPVAPCHHSAFDPRTGAFDLLLGDAAPATVGDELRGATIEQARLALSELGHVHGAAHASSGGAVIADWLVREAPVGQPMLAGLYAAFAERYAEAITPRQREVCERLVGSFESYLAAENQRPKGLVHGDYRLDNMLFGDPGADRPLTVVDWQTVTWGPALTDVAYFVGGSLPVDARREHYDGLLRAYHEALGPGAPLTLDQVREEVRRQSFFGVVMAIVSSMLVERTERGDQMFMTMLERHCSHVLDTGALDILAPPVPVEPLKPAPEDDDAHTPGGEPLWNESWYFDFVDTAAGFGGWIRLGLIPNQDHAWINVLVCGPGLPTVALNDFHAALPADIARVSGAGVELSLQRGEPLQTYRVTASGRAQAHDDPAALLRDESGTPLDVTVDLTWTSVGTPYLYRITPRYEIPCAVTGTVTVGEKTYPLDAVVGQRDHSWGVRDWWAMEWVWSALHLDDGTHLHAVDIRIPDMPPIGIGYTQREGDLVELESVTARHALGDDDLPVTTTLALQPGNIEATIDIQGHAPVKLTSAEGKISQFPRAWASVRTADGRTGAGWLEWNRNLG
ncbi:ecdysteroid 22-kinase family protein [Mycolicibacterium goodii]|uniref:ecdysteroid 22-kinase family protein n=1 Tax=Mycolicibacterium goodii TaxID=134601 RepID=UPI001F03C89C|nr:ecdysteroid 22-kinase family protein [Mycolicibacterium goodii]ULN45322.1 ecdysteroid 22-kinase family protein [Mycolicibacterium goodii]